MKPDVIVCWPRNCDYPLWRKWLGENRERFDEVFVVFTEHDGEAIAGWVQGQLGPSVQYLLSWTPAGGDWRDAAVNAALDLSHSEWVWFTEQDFFITDPDQFWWGVQDADETWGRSVIGWRDSTGRLHPSSLFVKRTAINATTRYFGTPPIDHFWTFSHELGDLGYLAMPLDPQTFEHLQGLTQNHSLIDRGEDAGVFKRDRFRQYLRDCLACGVALEPGWEAGAQREIGNADTAAALT